MQKTLWNGFERVDLTFEGKKAIVICPHKADENRNWILKTEYFDAFPEFEIEMINRGWHLTYVENITRWCLEEDIDRKRRFVEFVTNEYGLSKKCFILGQSCGGMIACKFAAKYPECVSAMYIDAPVMNLLSCPAGIGIGGNGFLDEFTNATGINLSQLISYRNNPIDHMDKLLKNNIPIFMAYGDMDDVVPYCENGELLERFYKNNGGYIEVICRRNCGHHPHGLDDNTPLVEFALGNCK